MPVRKPLFPRNPSAVKTSNYVRGGSQLKDVPAGSVNGREKEDKETMTKKVKSADMMKKIEDHQVMKPQESDSNADALEENEEEEEEENMTEEAREKEKEARLEESAQIIAMRKELLRFYDEPDVVMKWSKETERIIRATNYVQTIQYRCKSGLKGTSEEIDRAVDIIMQNLLELEIKRNPQKPRLKY